MTKRRVFLDFNGSKHINVEGLGVYVPAIENDHLKQKLGAEIQQLKDQLNAMTVDLGIAVKTAARIKTVTAERDQLEAKLSKLENLAARFIEDSEEIAEFFEASGGRNHLVLAKDVRKLANKMADSLNDQVVDNRHIDDAVNDIRTKAIRKFVTDTSETGQISFEDCDWLEKWCEEWLEEATKNGE